MNKRILSSGTFLFVENETVRGRHLYTYIYVRDGLHKQYTVLYNHKYCPLSRLFILPGQLAKVEEREQGEKGLGN